MINLIPPAAKKSIKIEYWVRVVTTWLIFWSVILLISASILFPTYVLIGVQVDVYKNSATEASEKMAGFEDVSNALTNASREARIIMDASEANHLSEYITLIEDLQGFDVQLKQIDIRRSSSLSQIDPITVSGVAKDRQALASFRDRLLAEKQIAVADLPISNLTQDKDIIFTITVTLTEQET